MDTVILQVPITRSIRDDMASFVENIGLSSIQDYVRLIFKKSLSGEIGVHVGPKPIVLSAKNAKRYDKMVEDVLSGKVKTKSFDNVDKMMEYLNSDN
jgi:hypothetical protein